MAAQDLTTLANVRAFIQKPSGSTEQDTVISSLITSASDVINANIARFLPAESAAAKTFVWRGGPLCLHPYFLRSASSVVTDTESGVTISGTSTTVSSSDYRLRASPPSNAGVYRWLRFPNDSYGTYGGVEREVTVTGDWGFASYATLPGDVVHWATVTVATWLRRDVSAFSTTLRLEEDRLERPDILPTAVVRGLAHYRLRTP